jgi:hypothetical protein
MATRREFLSQTVAAGGALAAGITQVVPAAGTTQLTSQYNATGFASNNYSV